MKRPQGFDRPAARPPGARPGPAASPAARSDVPPAAVSSPTGASKQAAAARTGARASGADPDRVATEPIELGPPALAAGATADGRRRSVPAGVHDTPPNSAGGDRAAPGPVSGIPNDSKGAKRALAAAARERRRYERQEVRRFTKRSRRRRIAWAVAGGAVALVTVGVVAGAYSPLMALREVRVEGAQRIPAAEVVAAFDGELGTPLPLIARDAVHDALADFSLIETYSTETIPPGTLVVRIVERTPVGVIDGDDGLQLVDGAGVVIERPEERPEGQPLITVEGGTASDGFRAVAAVVRSLPADVRVQLVAARATTSDDVELELAGGASVVWGGAGESVLKADVLAALMRAAPPDTVATYDVSSPETVVTE